MAAKRPDISDALADLIYRMLEKYLRRRISSMRLVGAEIETILETRSDVEPKAVNQESVDLKPKARRFETPIPVTSTTVWAWRDGENKIGFGCG